MLLVRVQEKYPTLPPGAGKQLKELKNLKEKIMTSLILKSLSRLHKDEAGQGLVEYALILALVAFAAVVAMQTLAKDINNAFTGIGAILSSYVP
jgi:pilus assembly protein Flp/PilA